MNEETCCGGPAPKDTNACCVKDADAKAAGETGCGYAAPPRDSGEIKTPQPSCCR